jgi:hypothetical protein
MKKSELHHIIQSGHGVTSVGVAFSVKPVVDETSIEGIEIDLAGYESAEVIMEFGTWVDGDRTFVIMESDSSGTSFSAVADADLLGGANSISCSSASDDEAVHCRGYIGDMRYLRVDVSSSASTGMIVSALVVRGHRRNKGVLNETA